MNYDYIGKNLDDIRERIQVACERSGRNPEDITLVSVTKTFDIDTIEASLGFGVYEIAENKVQEIEKKFPQLKNDIRKHMIGHLQRNKVKKVIDMVDMIQSVDSIRLLDEINKCSKNAGKITELLIQVNIGEEEQKYGFKESELEKAIEHASKLEHIKVLGFMAMAPFFEDAEKTRVYFKNMKSIFERFSNLSYNDKIEIKYLSMGMSGDFEIAIEEGANMIRVGSSIYGKRGL